MATKPETATNQIDELESQTVHQTKPVVYPQTNERVKGSILWLGLAFIILVVLVQQFSGYS